MSLSALWWAPLGVVAIGAGAAAVVMVRMDREITRLRESMRPLRATRRTPRSRDNVPDSR
jgi:hypothetical protein